MLTVLSVIISAAGYLESKGIKSARLNAELLLAHILSCKRLELYMSFDRPLQQNEIELYRDLLKRRIKFEPLQYIIGSVEFYGLELEVNPSVLIPRPETELLVETIIDNTINKDSIKILDVGTGSGNIAIALAKNIPSCQIIGIDTSEEALNTAARNARRNAVDEKVIFIKKNIFNETEIFNGEFDIVVSNPPYISAEDFNTLDSELRLYEPKLALTDSGDGLSFFREIAFKAESWLFSNGRLFFEIGAGHASAVNKILLENKFQNILIKKDYSGIERIIVGDKI